MQGCDVNQVKDFRANLTVPPIPPTDTSSCPIIQVEYFLKVGHGFSILTNFRGLTNI